MNIFATFFPESEIEEWDYTHVVQGRKTSLGTWSVVHF